MYPKWMQFYSGPSTLHKHDKLCFHWSVFWFMGYLTLTTKVIREATNRPRKSLDMTLTPPCFNIDMMSNEHGWVPPNVALCGKAKGFIFGLILIREPSWILANSAQNFIGQQLSTKPGFVACPGYSCPVREIRVVDLSSSYTWARFCFFPN